MEHKNKSLKIKDILSKDKKWLILILIFIVHIFLRFYQIEVKNTFGWDQVDNAWAAKDIIVDHKLPLLGMVAKQNSGFNIGPLYYYLLVPFYRLSDLDPIASGIFAGLTSIFTFFIIFYLTKKIFSFNVALIAVFIHTVSSYIINFDRIQWPINFIAPVSLIIFYSLYKIINGKEKYILLLAIILGISLHLNFTSIFFFFIVLVTIPFFPKTKNTIKYILLSLPLFLVWLIPNILVELNNNNVQTKHLIDYIQTYYHGFHLKRFFQLAPDAFIELEGILTFKILKYIEYFLYPIFFFVYLFKEKDVKRFVLVYLVGIWILVPWLVFTIYSGEISNYYFSLTRPIFIIVISCLIIKIFQIKNIFPKIAMLILLIYFSFYNISLFLNAKNQGLKYHENKVKQAMRDGKIIQFTQGDPESYIYYVYTRNKK